MNIDERLNALAMKGNLTMRIRPESEKLRIQLELETTINYIAVKFTGYGPTMAEAIVGLEDGLNRVASRLRVEVPGDE